jgi:hypothetical protein
LRRIRIHELVASGMTMAGHSLALCAVDGDGVRMGELAEAAAGAFVFTGAHGELAVLQADPGDHADGAVDDPGGAFVVVVAQLGDLVRPGTRGCRGGGRVAAAGV